MSEYKRGYMSERRAARRQYVITQLGGKCCKCGSTKDLEIDHKDRAQKSFKLSGKGLDRPWSLILTEMAKCQLLCSDCHRQKTVKEASGWSHGSVTGYTTYKCRCFLCKKAYSSWKRTHRARRKRAGLPRQ